jgi:rare lipoprotein A
MRRFLKIALLINGLWVTAVFPQSKGSKPQSGVSKTSKRILYGIASYYADKFNGRFTANGEVFSQKKMTAASNTLALNTWVRVTNLHNMKTAVVKITDRMYWKNRRLIDLSKSAARMLDYLSRGLTRVKIEVLGKKRPLIK